MAAAQRPAAVVRPFTRRRRVTMMAPAPDEADAGHHLGAQAGHVGVIMEVQVQELAGEGGHGRPQADQDMGAESRRPAFVLPLQSDQAAADYRQQHPQVWWTAW